MSDESVTTNPQALGETHVVHPSMVCWSCRSRNVASTDHDGHGAGEFVNPGNNGKFTVRCEDCGAVWSGQLRMTSSPTPRPTVTAALYLSGRRICGAHVCVGPRTTDIVLCTLEHRHGGDHDPDALKKALSR